MATENKFYKGELQDHNGSVMHPKTVAEQVYHNDGTTAEAKAQAILASIAAQAASVAATYLNAVTGGNVKGAVSTMDWGTFSASAGGVAMIAENAYIDKDAGTFHYKNTHASCGARGIVLHPTSGIGWFDTGGNATTAGAQFTPNVRTLQSAPFAKLYDGDLNNLMDTGFFNGAAMANAPGTGWFYIINIGHTHSPGSFRVQMAFDFEGNEMRLRTCYGSGSWSAWRSVITSKGGTIDGDVEIRGDGDLFRLVGKNWVHVPFYKNGIEAGRSAYLGFGDTHGVNFSIQNDMAGGGIRLHAENGVTINGYRVPTTYMSTAEPTAADGANGDVWHQYV